MPNRPASASAPRRRTRYRGSSSQQGYGGEWRRIRLVVLSEETRCRRCGASGQPSDHVDHIRSRRLGGSDDRSNLQRLCRSCHSFLTAHHDGGWGNRLRPGKAVGT